MSINKSEKRQYEANRTHFPLKFYKTKKLSV